MPRLFIAIYRSVIAQDFSALSDWFWDECKAMKRGWELFIFSGLVIFILTSCWDSRIEDGLKNEIVNLKEDNRNMKQDIAALNTQLIPFRTIALQKYTGSEAEAVRKLGESIAAMQQMELDSARTIIRLEHDLEETKIKAAPVALIPKQMQIQTNGDSTITAKMVFVFSKNGVPAIIQLIAQVGDNSTNTITGFDPDASCGAFQSGAGMHQVSENRKVHLLTYSPIGGIATCVNFTVSGESSVQISRNCDVKPFVLQMPLR